MEMGERKLTFGALSEQKQKEEGNREKKVSFEGSEEEKEREEGEGERTLTM